MAANIFQAMLIFTISISLVAMAYVFIVPQIQTFLDTQEISNTRNALEACGTKILDTARTGNDNFCSFSVKRGELTIKRDGIYYSIDSNGKICDLHNWVELKPHLWSYCPDKRTLSMKWSWPYEEAVEGYSIQGSVAGSSISFDESIPFRTLTVHIEFEVPANLTGRNIYLRRISLTESKAVVGIKIE